MKISLQNATPMKNLQLDLHKTSDLLFGFLASTALLSAFIKSCSFRLLLDCLKLEIALIRVSLWWTFIIISYPELTQKLWLPMHTKNANLVKLQMTCKKHPIKDSSVQSQQQKHQKKVWKWLILTKKQKAEMKKLQIFSLKD